MKVNCMGKNNLLLCSCCHWRNDGATINSHELYPDVPEIREAENPPVNSPVLQQQNGNHDLIIHFQSP